MLKDLLVEEESFQSSMTSDQDGRRGMNSSNVCVLYPTLQKVVDPKYSAKVTFSLVLVK
ncbi:MAG: hypothetical protein ACI81P_003340 [Neolewinella sp.]|jgi:hypothetical protein